jgi:hypothetical protein
LSDRVSIAGSLLSKLFARWDDAGVMRAPCPGCIVFATIFMSFGLINRAVKNGDRFVFCLKSNVRVRAIYADAEPFVQRSQYYSQGAIKTRFLENYHPHLSFSLIDGFGKLHRKAKQS